VPKKLTREEKIRKYKIKENTDTRDFSIKILSNYESISLSDIITKANELASKDDIDIKESYFELELENDYEDYYSYLNFVGKTIGRPKTDEEIDEEIKRIEEIKRQQRFYANEQKKRKLEADKKTIAYLKKKYPEEFAK
jgi:hypothetical protein